MFSFMCGRLIIPTIDGLKFVSMKHTRDLATHARFLAIQGCLLIIGEGRGGEGRGREGRGGEG